jgi:hypothetical protein
MADDYISNLVAKALSGDSNTRTQTRPTAAAPSGLDPEMQEKIDKLSQEVKARGGRLSITSGRRSTERQAQLYANRANNPYPVAPPGSSKHERGRAADLAWSGIDQDSVVKIADELGLQWGGRFKRTDPVHFQLPDGDSGGQVAPSGRQTPATIVSSILNGGTSTKKPLAPGPRLDMLPKTVAENSIPSGPMESGEERSGGAPGIGSYLSIPGEENLGRTRAAAGNFGRGWASVLASPFDLASVIQSYLTGTPIDETLNAQAAKWIRNTNVGFGYPDAPDEYQKSFLYNDLPQGAGNLAGMIMGGVASGGSRLATAAIGGALGAQQGVTDAEESGATPEQTRLSGLLNIPIGLVDSLVPGEIAGEMTGKVVRQKFLRSLVEKSLEEGSTEYVQQIGQNAVARGIGYAPDRPWDEGAWRAAAAGAILGGGAETLTHGINLDPQRKLESEGHYVGQDITGRKFVITPDGELHTQDGPDRVVLPPDAIDYISNAAAKKPKVNGQEAKFGTDAKQGDYIEASDGRRIYLEADESRPQSSNPISQTPQQRAVKALKTQADAATKRIIRSNIPVAKPSIGSPTESLELEMPFTQMTSEQRWQNHAWDYAMAASWHLYNGDEDWFKNSQESLPEGNRLSEDYKDELERRARRLLRGGLAQSQARDTTGNILRLYHGTPEAYHQYSPTKDSGINTYGEGFNTADDPGPAAGAYSEGFDLTKKDSRPNVRPVFLDLHNPLDLRTKEGAEKLKIAAREASKNPDTISKLTALHQKIDSWWSNKDTRDELRSVEEATTEAVAKEKGLESLLFPERKADVEPFYMRTIAEGLGFDGIAHTGGEILAPGLESGSHYNVWIAFHPEQIVPALYTDNTKGLSIRETLDSIVDGWKDVIPDAEAYLKSTTAMIEPVLRGEVALGYVVADGFHDPLSLGMMQEMADRLIRHVEDNKLPIKIFAREEEFQDPNPPVDANYRYGVSDDFGGDDMERVRSVSLYAMSPEATKRVLSKYGIGENPDSFIARAENEAFLPKTPEKAAIDELFSEHRKRNPISTQEAKARIQQGVATSEDLDLPTSGIEEVGRDLYHPLISYHAWREAMIKEFDGTPGLSGKIGQLWDTIKQEENQDSENEDPNNILELGDDRNSPAYKFRQFIENRQEFQNPMGIPNGDGNGYSLVLGKLAGGDTVGWGRWNDDEEIRNDIADSPHIQMLSTRLEHLTGLLGEFIAQEYEGLGNKEVAEKYRAAKWGGFVMDPRYYGLNYPQEYGLTEHGVGNIYINPFVMAKTFYKSAYLYNIPPAWQSGVMAAKIVNTLVHEIVHQEEGGGGTNPELRSDRSHHHNDEFEEAYTRVAELTMQFVEAHEQELVKALDRETLREIGKYARKAYNSQFPPEGGFRDRYAPRIEAQRRAEARATGNFEGVSPAPDRGGGETITQRTGYPSGWGFASDGVDEAPTRGKQSRLDSIRGVAEDLINQGKTDLENNRRSRKGILKSSLDPIDLASIGKFSSEDIPALTKIAVGHILKGGTDFYKFSSDVGRLVGDSVLPYLRQAWDQAQELVSSHKRKLEENEELTSYHKGKDSAEFYRSAFEFYDERVRDILARNKVPIVKDKTNRRVGESMETIEYHRLHGNSSALNQYAGNRDSWADTIGIAEYRDWRKNKFRKSADYTLYQEADKARAEYLQKYFQVWGHEQSILEAEKKESPDKRISIMGPNADINSEEPPTRRKGEPDIPTPLWNKALNDVQDRQRYGKREETPARNGYRVMWFNGSKAWLVTAMKVNKGETIELDSNEIIIEGKRGIAEAIARKLPPHPLFSLSYEQNLGKGKLPDYEKLAKAHGDGLDVDDRTDGPSMSQEDEPPPDNLTDKLKRRFQVKADWTPDTYDDGEPYLDKDGKQRQKLQFKVIDSETGEERGSFKGFAEAQKGADSLEKSARVKGEEVGKKAPADVPNVDRKLAEYYKLVDIYRAKRENKMAAMIKAVKEAQAMGIDGQRISEATNGRSPYYTEPQREGTPREKVPDKGRPPFPWADEKTINRGPWPSQRDSEVGMGEPQTEFGQKLKGALDNATLSTDEDTSARFGPSESKTDDSIPTWEEYSLSNRRPNPNLKSWKAEVINLKKEADRLRQDRGQTNPQEDPRDNLGSVLNRIDFVQKQIDEEEDWRGIQNHLGGPSMSAVDEAPTEAPIKGKPLIDERPNRPELTQTQLKLDIHKDFYKMAGEVLAKKGVKRNRAVTMQQQTYDTIVNASAEDLIDINRYLENKNIDLTSFMLGLAMPTGSDAGRVLNTLSQVAKSLGDKARREPSFAKELERIQKSQLTKLDSLGQGLYARWTGIFKGAMVAAWSTATRNAASQGARLGIDAMVDGLDGALQVNRELANRPGGVHPLDGLEILLQLGKEAKTTAQQGAAYVKGKLTGKAQTAPVSVADQLLSALPGLSDKLYQTFLSDVENVDLKLRPRATKAERFTGKVEDAVQLLNALNVAQEFTVRRSVFVAKMFQEAKNNGIDLHDIIERNDRDAMKNLPKEMWEASIHKALDASFAAEPESEVGIRALQTFRAIQKHPLGMGVLFDLPFPRFLIQALKFHYQYSPISIPELLFSDKAKAQIAAGDHKRIARAAIGTAMLGIGYAMAAARKDDERWYEFYGFDTRPFNPFAGYMFLGDAIYRKIHGLEFDYTASEFINSLMAMGSRADTSLTILGRLVGVVTQEDSKGVGQHAAEYAGDVVSRFFQPATTVKDIYASTFDKWAEYITGHGGDEAVLRDVDTENPLLAPTMNKFPGLSQMLPEAQSPTRADAPRQKAPWAKQLLGLRFVEDRNP